MDIDQAKKIANYAADAIADRFGNDALADFHLFCDGDDCEMLFEALSEKASQLCPELFVRDDEPTS